MTLPYVKARDFEILRTLLRVQFATTRSLLRVFFEEDSWGRKRLALLRYKYGLIVPHSKGLPGAHVASGGQFWCLTQAGIDALVNRYPDIRVPANHYCRCRKASLRNFEHRSACAELYLGLISFKSRDIDQICARADEISWYFDKDVRLPYMSVVGVTHKPKEVLPDATLITGHSRIFLELDRSTEGLRICRAALNAYRNAMDAPGYSAALPGTAATIVVYVTKTEERAKNLRALIESLGKLPFRALAMESRQAAKWLSTAVTDPPGDGLPLPTFADCMGYLRKLYDVSNVVGKERLPEVLARKAALQKEGIEAKPDELLTALRDTFAFFELVAKAA